MSISETRLWGLIRRNRLGFQFRRQYAIGRYFLDFYCPEAKLCVEVDGEQHELRRDLDQARDEFLLSLGIETLRIPSIDLFEKDGQGMDDALEAILTRCETRTGREGVRDWW